MNNTKSQELYKEGQKHLVGSVNSPVRAFSSVGGNPLFMEKASGSKIDPETKTYQNVVIRLVIKNTLHVHQ